MMNREQAIQDTKVAIQAVDTEVITESAKKVLVQNPLSWHRTMEQTLLNESKLLDDQDAKKMFQRIFVNFHEKISTKISLLSFVGWLKEEEIQIDAVNEQIVLIPTPGKDRYDVLDTFADKFSW